MKAAMKGNVSIQRCFNRPESIIPCRLRFEHRFFRAALTFIMYDNMITENRVKWNIITKKFGKIFKPLSMASPASSDCISRFSFRLLQTAG